MPTVTNVKRQNGVAGAYVMTADVTYEGEPPERIAFHGSTYGPLITMVTPGGNQVFVSDRKLDADWVRAYFE